VRYFSFGQITAVADTAAIMALLGVAATRALSAPTAPWNHVLRVIPNPSRYDTVSDADHPGAPVGQSEPLSSCMERVSADADFRFLIDGRPFRMISRGQTWRRPDAIHLTP